MRELDENYVVSFATLSVGTPKFHVQPKYLYANWSCQLSILLLCELVASTLDPPVSFMSGWYTSVSEMLILNIFTGQLPFTCYAVLPSTKFFHSWRKLNNRTTSRCTKLSTGQALKFTLVGSFAYITSIQGLDV